MAWGSNLFPLLIVVSSGGFTGFFVYSPTVGPNNLLASIAAQPGTDPFGNKYQGASNTGAFTSYQGGTDSRATSLGGKGLIFLQGSESAGYVATGFLGPFPAIAGVPVNYAVTLDVGAGVSQVFLVGPSGDTTGATDSATLNNLFLTTGAKIVLMPGNFWVNQTVQIPGNTALVGAYPIQFGPSRILMANGANLDAVVASAGWNASINTTSTAPVLIRDLVIDGNQSNQTGGLGHGLVLQTFGAYVEDVIVQNPRGDGFRLDFFGANGTTGITNTAVENRFHRCKTLGSSSSGSSFRTTDPLTTASFTDGFLTDCIFAMSGGSTNVNPQVFINASAGWKITGNHLYGMSGGGINCQRPFATRIANNYIEPFGTNTAAHFYGGITCANAQSTQGAVIADNTVLMTATAGNAGSTILGIDCETGNGQTAAYTITGNHIVGPAAAPAAATYGIYVQNDNAAGTTTLVSTGNNVVGTFTAASPHLVPNGGVINSSAGV